ncbi:MAG: acylneuraminate cytidylyltransferase family protein [Candidatus Omnitrophota bacterium]
MKILAVIPARGGSKGLNRKNIRPLAGKPLIAWTIEAALKVPRITKVICSTEDREIANFASIFGCEVPFTRPQELATDSARSGEVLMHAIEFLEHKGERYDAVMCLQCTTPLRSSEHINAAIDLFEKKISPTLVSVCEVSEPPYWMYTIGPENKLNSLIKSEYATKQRQSQPKVFLPNGAIYISDVDNFKKTRTFYVPAPAAFVMERCDSVDIDYDIEFKLAELLMEENNTRSRL